MTFEKKLNLIVIALYLGGCVAITSFILITGRERLVFSLLSPLFLLAPLLLERIFRLNRNYMLNSVFYIFVFLAYCIGVTLGVYLSNIVYDKIVHFFSGVLFFAIGAYVYELMRGMEFTAIAKLPSREHALFISFAFLFATATGPVWEAYEFVYDWLSGEDCQHVLDSGVSDTMQDMISCIFGALILAVIYLYLLRKKGTSAKPS